MMQFLSIFISLAIMGYEPLHNNQINVYTLIGQSAMVYCGSKLVKKFCIFWILIM